MKKIGFKNLKNNLGFTLIEVVVYLGLFAILMGGMVTAAYSVFESSDRDQTKIMIQEEGDFLIAKINWALSGMQAINTPFAESIGSILSVNKWDASGSTIPVTINLTGTDMFIINSINPPIELNNSNVMVKNLIFTHIYNDDSNESIQVNFTLESKTANGMSASQDFSTTKYIRN
jgi:hypothetical protein